MTVSVVMPTYNRGYVIAQAVQSILAQTYRDYEILVVDDGSSDNTRDVIESLKSDRLRYFHHDHNRGCSAGYNTGILAASGELIAFLDSDDLWKPEYLERQLKCFARYPDVDVVFSDTEIDDRDASIPSLMSLMQALPKLLSSRPRDSEYRLSPREIYLCLLEEVPVKPSAMVVRRNALAATSLFDEAWPSGTDWDLLLRLSRKSSFAYTDRVLVTQRRTGDATHQIFKEQDKRFLIDLFLKEKEALREDREGFRAVNRGIGRLYNSLGWTYLEKGLWRMALSLYWKGFLETEDIGLLRKILLTPIHICRQSLS